MTTAEGVQLALKIVTKTSDTPKLEPKNIEVPILRLLDGKPKRVDLSEEDVKSAIEKFESSEEKEST